MIKLNKNLKKLIIPAIGGLLLVGYMLYENSERFGVSETVVVVITTVIILGIILFINKIVSKNV